MVLPEYKPYLAQIELGRFGCQVPQLELMLQLDDHGWVKDTGLIHETKQNLSNYFVIFLFFFTIFEFFETLPGHECMSDFEIFAKF